jgi:hypothetical protein
MMFQLWMWEHLELSMYCSAVITSLTSHTITFRQGAGLGNGTDDGQDHKEHDQF